MPTPTLIFLAGMALGIALTLITLGLWIIAAGEPVDDGADERADVDRAIDHCGIVVVEGGDFGLAGVHDGKGSTR